MKSSLSSKIVALIILIICTIAVVLGVWLALGSFDTVKAVIDSLTSDGNFESFTPEVFNSLRKISIVALLLAAPVLFIFIFFREKFYAIIQSIIHWLEGIKSLGKDGKIFFTDLKQSIPEKSDLLFLILFIILGAALRAMLSSLPMQHDEAYTFVVFARRDLGTIFQDYHLPNNHVFHTILVHFSMLVFGTQPWAIRLPAVLSILGLTPVGYLVGRYYFNRKVGLLIGISTAILPNFILVSLDARGYPVVTLILFILWALAIYLKKMNNLFAWLLFILFSTLGFFTLPMMLYGFGMVIGWLFVSWLFKDVSPEYPRWVFLRSLILSGLAIVILTMLLYTPIILKNGTGALFNNPIVQQLKVPTLELLGGDFFNRVGKAWKQWHTGFGAWFSYATLLGVGWAWLRFRKISSHSVSVFWVGLLWILGLLVVQMLVGWPRIWLFLAPIYFLYAIAGWADIINQGVRLAVKGSFDWGPAVLVLLVILVGSANWWFKDSQYQQLLGGRKGYNQMAAEFIAESSQDTDLIVVISPDAPVVWYYGLNLGTQMRRYNLNSEITFTHALLLVNTEEGQTIQGLLGSKSLLVPSFDQIELVYQSGPLEIYRTPILNLSP